MPTSAEIALPVISRIASADTYPTRPVRMIVGFPPGGFTDTTARLIGQWLSERLGQSFVIENRPGASSNIATEAVVRSAPDGYTLLTVTDANAYNATVYDNLNFNFIRDITPVASIGRVAFVMVVNPSFAAKTVPEFIANARANPAKFNMATVGPGSPSQLFGVLFKVMASVDLVTVDYRGIGPALLDLMSGRVEVIFTSVASTIDLIRSGKLRPIIRDLCESIVACDRLEFTLQRQPSVRQAALQHLPTPMPFLTGRFRACVSSSRAAYNGRH